MRAFIAALFLAFAVFAAGPAPAATSLQQSLNWVNAWGGIDFTSDADPVIPALQHQAKSDIKNVVKACGTDKADLSGINTYTVDFNDDGRADFISDGTAYFKNHFNPACYTTICTAEDGCYISVYKVDVPTNLIGQAPGNSTCPATAALNTNCKSWCPATAGHCPGNFKYNMKVIFSAPVKTWQFIKASEFQLTASTSYVLINANPVFVTEQNSTKCYLDELSLNNNRCVKYYQYDAATDAFVDLYVPPNVNGSEDDTRFTYTPYDRSHAHLARGMVMAGEDGGGFGHRLVSGGSVHQQFATFDYGDGRKQFMCYIATNASGNDYFVPTNTDNELVQFFNHLPEGVSKRECELKFTDWVGDTDCAKIQNPSGQSVTIAAQRFCQRSSSSYASCQECVDAKVPGFEKGCNLVQQCPGTQCLIAVTPPWPEDQAKYAGHYTSLQDCYDAIGMSQAEAQSRAGGGLYMPEYWVLNNMWQRQYPGDPYGTMSKAMCDVTFDLLCAEGHLCLAGDTEIALPHGKTARINTIKAGDKVLGFLNVKGKLVTVKVKRLAITEKEPLIDINHGKLLLTKEHRVVTGTGSLVRAAKLLVGDTLLQADGKVLKIDSIKVAPNLVTVYNLELEKGLGFVANGLLVSSYKVGK